MSYPNIQYKIIQFPFRLKINEIKEKNGHLHNHFTQMPEFVYSVTTPVNGKAPVRSAAVSGNDKVHLLRYGSGKRRQQFIPLRFR